MFEYAYFKENLMGNSKEMVEFLSKFRKFFEAGIVRELAFTSGGLSFFAVREPILLAVRAQGDIGDAKFHALKLLKELGYVDKEAYNLEEVFKFVEKIEQMPLEEFLKEMKRLREQI
ncbi:MAG: hypothetical protein NOM71_05975 [Archaeoglobi archaeon]|jgi:hypothetical protein|nr:hypothetical protein [Archaeoglobi archaeon]TDA26439.1 MAG: hypothetical protein DSO00_07525 [Archaeoglobi archaeon]